MVGISSRLRLFKGRPAWHLQPLYLKSNFHNALVSDACFHMAHYLPPIATKTLVERDIERRIRYCALMHEREGAAR